MTRKVLTSAERTSARPPPPGSPGVAPRAPRAGTPGPGRPRAPGSRSPPRRRPRRTRPVAWARSRTSPTTARTRSDAAPAASPNPPSASRCPAIASLVGACSAMSPTSPVSAATASSPAPALRARSASSSRCAARACSTRSRFVGKCRKTVPIPTPARRAIVLGRGLDALLGEHLLRGREDPTAVGDGVRAHGTSWKRSRRLRYGRKRSRYSAHPPRIEVVMVPARHPRPSSAPSWTG